MNFRDAGRRPRTLEMDMTPLIDIVFQLLIFFLTTTQLASQARMELELPRERGLQSGRGEEPALIVNLRHDGAILVLDEEVSLEQVAELAARARESGSALDRAAPRRPVIRADRGAPAASLNALLVAMRDAGVEGVTFAVSPGR